ncbi:MAG: FprA family A-type flavoprotein, partial [Candidatus Cloacimonadota bacterium]
VASAAFLANMIKPKARFATVIGSYGWAGKLVERIAGMIGNLKVELLPPVMVKGFPKENDFRALDELADAILEKHKSLDI